MRKNELWSDSTAIPNRGPKLRNLQPSELLERHFNVLVQESHDVFEIIKLDGTIEYISPALERILGYKPEDRIGKKAYELLANEEKLRFLQLINYIITQPNQVAHGEFIARSKTGKEVALQVDMRNGLSEPTIGGIIINWRESVLSHHEEDHQARALLDGLTGLPNKAAFEAHIGEEILSAQAKGQAFGLMIIDIDRFKYMNSYLGYELGDQLLSKISQRLQMVLRTEVFLCRYSVDQFALLISSVNESNDCEELANAIIRHFKSPFLLENCELDISLRIGISMFPQDAQNVEILIKAASMASLQITERGKSRYRFHTADVKEINNRKFLLRSDMCRALEKGQFKVYYQPLVNLRTYELLAVEALLRWEHPQFGMISPSEFIPLMEESGFIMDVGEWLLDEVCCNYKQWQKQGVPPTKISINYSSIQFTDEFLVEKTREVLKKYGLDPNFLIIEITESVLMDNVDKVIADIRRLQRMGIKVAVDDFGSGFSSLSYLSKLNMDILKIDSSFIQKIPCNKACTIITKSVINMAQELNIWLVAEGIETKEQLAHLQQFNCHTGQGFLFSKPVPGTEMEVILTSQKCQVV